MNVLLVGLFRIFCEGSEDLRKFLLKFAERLFTKSTGNLMYGLLLDIRFRTFFGMI